MPARRIVPNLVTGEPGATAAFFEQVAGLETVMDLGWVQTLASPDQPLAQISLLAADATAPVTPDLSVEVDDVDHAFVTAVERGDEIVHPLTHEDWGVRRFLVRAPSGHVINVLHHDEAIARRAT